MRTNVETRDSLSSKPLEDLKVGVSRKLKSNPADTTEQGLSKRR